MKKTGFLLITVTFLAGSLAAVVDQAEVRWTYFIPIMIVGAVGVFLVHYHERKNTRSQTKLASNLQDIQTSLTNLVEGLTTLNAQKQSINAYDFHARIDELFRDDLAMFAQARESLAHAHNLQVYADVMSHFASGERYINRIWSASVDGYIDEINTYLDKAQSQFTEALEIVSQLKNSD